MRRLGLVLVAALGFVDCKPGPGSSCDHGEARCINKTTQLICQGGKFVLAPCKGPRGCGLTPSGVACDISGNSVGDPCTTDDEGATACIGATTKLQCAGGRFISGSCRGPKGCQTVEGRANCDMTIAEPGDVCKEADRVHGCSVDGKQYLACVGTKMEMRFQCLGPNGCKSEDGQLNCDMAFARDQDPCIGDMEGKHACNLDRSSIVVCKSGKFAIDEECKKGTHCSAEGGLIKCAKPEAEKPKNP